jgi:hypothetical protein
MDTNFNWAAFKGRGSKVGSYEISVMKTGSKGKNGGFGFLSGFFKKHSLNEFSYVSLFYDEAKKSIGFIFNNDKDYTGAFKLTKGKGGKSGQGSASVFPNSFWSAFNINIAEWAGRYTPKEISDEKLGKVYYIELKNKIDNDKQETKLTDSSTKPN